MPVTVGVFAAILPPFFCPAFLVTPSLENEILLDKLYDMIERQW